VLGAKSLIKHATGPRFIFAGFRTGAWGRTVAAFAEIGTSRIAGRIGRSRPGLIIYCSAEPIAHRRAPPPRRGDSAAWLRFTALAARGLEAVNRHAQIMAQRAQERNLTTPHMARLACRNFERTTM
jgi:hypothetical protein